MKRLMLQRKPTTRTIPIPEDVQGLNRLARSFPFYGGGVDSLYELEPTEMGTPQIRTGAPRLHGTSGWRVLPTQVTPHQTSPQVIPPQNMRLQELGGAPSPPSTLGMVAFPGRQVGETDEIRDVEERFADAEIRMSCYDLMAQQVMVLLLFESCKQQDFSTYISPIESEALRVTHYGTGQKAADEFEIIDYKWDEDEYIAEKAVLKYNEQIHADP